MGKLSMFDDPNFLRVEVNPEAQRAYLWMWGGRYEIRTLEMRRDEPNRLYNDALLAYSSEDREIVLGVRPAPEPAPPPAPVRRRWSTAMGLRRPTR